MDTEDHIPEDVLLTSILPHLSAKSALRFQLVSKLWHSIISDPYFTSLHHYIAKNRNPKTYLIIGAHLITGSIVSVKITADRETTTLQVIPGEYAPLRSLNSYSSTEIVGACSGLICVAYAQTAVLWNPATREEKKIRVPYPGIQVDWSDPWYLGFAPVEDKRGNSVNFKLLVMKDLWRREIVANQFLVYSLCTDTWSLVEPPRFSIDKCWFYRQGGVYLNGALHWLVRHRRDEERLAPFYVLTFEVATETFGMFDLPSDKMRDCDLNFCTLLDDEYLSVVGSVEWNTSKAAVWVMRKYGDSGSWVKDTSFRPWLGPSRKVLGYLDHIRTLLVQDYMKGDVYLPVKGGFSMHQTGLSGRLKLFPCAESLVSMKSQLRSLSDINLSYKNW